MQNCGKILIVGDLFPVPSNFDRFVAGDLAYLFGDTICSLFRSADYRICNLEGALTDRPGKCEKTGPVIYAPTATVRTVKDLGIDCCTLANNHITDAGSQGVRDTMDTLDREGIAHLGAGRDAESLQKSIIFPLGGRRIGLYNVAETMYNEPGIDKPGAHLYDEYRVCKELADLKATCDYLIVVYHGGAEKYRYPSPQTRQRFHRMVDSGADMVLSQHTHCVGSEEYYKGAYLLYGQGNFLFRSFNNAFTDTGLILELLFDETGVQVRKHLVNAVSDTVRYDAQQDFSDFDARAARIGDERFLQEQFANYCLQELPLYLEAFKGRNLFLKVLHRVSPKYYRRLLLRSYERRQAMFTLHTLRSEQNREIAISGLKAWLQSDSAKR